MRKRIIGILFLTLLITASCSKKENEKLRIASPQGAPLLAQFNIDYNNLSDNKYTIDKLTGPADIKEALIENKYDLIYAPINLGMSIYNTNKSYCLLRGITFGNLYFGSKENINSIEDLNNKDIVLFGKNTINDVIANHLFDYYNITPNNIEYVSDTATSKTQFVASSDKVYLLADPTKSLSYYSLLSNNINTYYLSLQDLLNESDGIDGFAQAGLFIKKDLSLNDSRVIEYLNSLNESIDLLNNSDLIESNNSKIKELGYYNFSNQILLSAISGSNIRYVKASDMKDIVEKTYSLKLELVGGSLADEGFYKD